MVSLTFTVCFKSMNSSNKLTSNPASRKLTNLPECEMFFVSNYTTNKQIYVPNECLFHIYKVVVSVSRFLDPEIQLYDNRLKYLNYPICRKRLLKFIHA